MDDEAGRQLHHAIIPDDIVVDGEIEELVVGSIITHGFRVAATSPPSTGDFVGRVRWARRDHPPGGPDEAIVDVGGVPFLISPANRSVHRVGEVVPVIEPLVSVRPHEYSAFEIPDIRRRWMLHEVQHERAQSRWLVTVEPLDPAPVRLAFSPGAVLPRSFTAHELSILTWIVQGAPDEAVLLQQIDAATFGEPWFEGSQSFSIVVDDEVPPYESGRHTAPNSQIGPGALVYGRPAPSDDFIGEMMLWFRDGVLCDLEYWWVTDEMPDHLPDLDQLRRD